MKIYLLLLSLLFSCLAISQDKLEHAIDKVLDAHINSEKGPGLTLGIVKNGRLIYQKNRACMNLEYRLPFNDSTIFSLASVSKQFTSACIGILAKKGKLKLQDDVRKYIPELAQYKDTIRVKHLLNHTSGIRNHNVLLNLKGFDYKHRGYTNKMIEALMFKQKGLNNVPGAKMLYSNTNYVLLALIIERVSGMQLHEFARKEIFEPLKMENSFYTNKLEEIIANRAYPYYQYDGEFLQSKSLTLCVGAGGVMCTIKDLTKWSQVFLDKQHPFNYLKDFLTELDTFNNGERMKHARGIFVSPYKGFISYNHSGRGLGMRAQFICIPKENIAVIIYTNSEDINAVNISYEILDLFLQEGYTEEKQLPTNKHFKNDLKSIVGVYQELNSDLRMRVFIENDSLKALSSYGKRATPLNAQGANIFCRIDNTSIVYDFTKNKNSASDLRVDFGGAIFYFEKIELSTQPNQNLNEFVGSYYSKELDVKYTISLERNQLILDYPNNEHIVINEGVKDSFGANMRTIYTFKRNDSGKVVAMEVASEGTVKGILFSMK